MTPKSPLQPPRTPTGREISRLFVHMAGPKGTDRFRQDVIAARIKQRRELVDPPLTRKDMARLAEIEMWSYYKKEKGEVPFRLDELSRVAEVLKAPSLWPVLDWDAAILVEKMLKRP